MKRHRAPELVGLLLIAAGIEAPLAMADSSLFFSDIAADSGSGLAYSRVPSARNAAMDALVGGPPLTFLEAASTPAEPRGIPGVAIFDHDRDGDLDIYVTNGPGAANSLFSNQRVETGLLTFVDVATAAGVAAVHQDSTGVSFGDIDNDGDHDLLVLGSGEPNLLFENNGDGTFNDITEHAGIGGGNLSHIAASMGDIDGDGLLDIVVANSFPHESLLPIFLEPFALNQHNQLYRNLGGNAFADVSETSGIRDLGGVDPGAVGEAGITWAIAMVDIDRDGDVDILTADDQAGVLPAAFGGVDRGVLHWWRNDGTGHFVDVSHEAGLDIARAWMGLAFGDFDANGHLDFFASNFGDPSWVLTGLPIEPGAHASRWFLNRGDGTFDDPGVGDLVTTPFGWGCAARDFDNDGDTDILFHGGLNGGFVMDASNPGTLLLNDGAARFTYDADAFADSTDHLLRTVHGLAVGDLDDDGWVDAVSVSGFDIPADALLPTPFVSGSVFDAFASFVPVLSPTDDDLFAFNESIQTFPNGSLAVEISGGEHTNGWVTVSTLGTVGLTAGGRVNRDGIGAVVGFTPVGGQQALQPILGGSSHASQNSLTAHFGLGDGHRGSADVWWPGGIHNRLYHVRRGERLVFPEIPCSIDAAVAWPTYASCVFGSLVELVDAGVLDHRQALRFLASALRAFRSDA